jgi:hypothetical protein
VNVAALAHGLGQLRRDLRRLGDPAPTRTPLRELLPYLARDELRRLREACEAIKASDDSARRQAAEILATARERREAGSPCHDGRRELDPRSRRARRLTEVEQLLGSLEGEPGAAALREVDLGSASIETLSEAAKTLRAACGLQASESAANRRVVGSYLEQAAAVLRGEPKPPLFRFEAKRPPLPPPVAADESGDGSVSRLPNGAAPFELHVTRAKPQPEPPPAPSPPRLREQEFALSALVWRSKASRASETLARLYGIEERVF